MEAAERLEQAIKEIFPHAEVRSTRDRLRTLEIPESETINPQ